MAAIDLSVLSTTREPWILQAFVSTDKLISLLNNRLPEDTHMVILEGSRMQSTAGFYDELVEKFKLPDYFGRNLNALNECLTDLEWLGLRGQAVVVIVRDAEVLLQSDRELFEAFMDVMRYAGKEWSNAVAEGADWDRPPVPFHVILTYRDRDAFNSLQLPHLEIVESTT